MIAFLESVNFSEWQKLVINFT